MLVALWFTSWGHALILVLFQTLFILGTCPASQSPDPLEGWSFLLMPVRGLRSQWRPVECLDAKAKAREVSPTLV